MKRTALAMVAVMMMLLAQSCKKEDAKKDVNAALARKYAKFSAPVYKNKELKEWLTTLAKAEYVDLLDVSDITVNKRTRTIARVRLSDDTEGYMDMNHLADRPIVFLEDTRAHVRNNSTSTVHMTVPRGTIAFIIAERAEWVQVYAGKINDKVLNKQWVRGGFTAEEGVILEARAYEEAVAALESDESTESSRNDAIARLEEIARSSQAFGDMARGKLGQIKVIDDETAPTQDTQAVPEKTPHEE